MSTLKTTNIQHPSAGSPAVELTAAGGLWLGGGKILQIVRATDSTGRETSSTSFTDVTGMTVTITPQKSTSAIIVITNVLADPSDATGRTMSVQITDSSNNALSGAENFQAYSYGNYPSYRFMHLIGYSTPATTSATTYKTRFKTSAGSSRIKNDVNTGQMYAIEVSA